jgi:hypothetical protein
LTGICWDAPWGIRLDSVSVCVIGGMQLQFILSLSLLQRRRRPFLFRLALVHVHR